LQLPVPLPIAITDQIFAIVLHLLGSLTRLDDRMIDGGLFFFEVLS